jgi:hypothetical protein
MDFNHFVTSLKKSAEKIEAMSKGVSEDQARWKSEPEKWSILEVINHLYDEEREDFRKRLDLTLHHPKEQWPGIDPQSWVSLRNYNQKDYQDSLHNFLSERDKSLQWLKSLSSPNLNQNYTHPIIGTLTAGDLLAAWAAHDYLHIRQVANLQIKYLDTMARPFSIRYASP